MFQRCLAILAWLALGFIIFVTLSPIGLRPALGHDPLYERIVAYALLGLMFGLAYPRRLWITLSFVIGTAVILEGLQNLTPDRHAHLRDLVEKVSGGWLGVTMGNAFSKRLPRL
jgi:membrane protease YdiL (CAAX protease family)